MFACCRALLAILLATAAAAEANACECGRKRTVQEARAGSAYVVTAYVRGVHPGVVRGSSLRPVEGLSLPKVWPVSIVDLATTRSFDRRAPRKIQLTHIGCCVCEAELKPGKEYLLFILPSYEVPGAYMVSFCFPNRPVSDAGPLIAQLPQGTKYPRGTDSRFSGLKWSAEHLGNVAARVYLRRTGDFPYMSDPFASIRESPWLPFSGYVAAGAVLACVVVLVGRRIRRT